MRILPKNAILFVIYRNTQDIIDCRIENKVDPDFKFRLNIYKELLTKSYICPVDNRKTVQESIAQIRIILGL